MVHCEFGFCREVDTVRENVSLIKRILFISRGHRNGAKMWQKCLNTDAPLLLQRLQVEISRTHEVILKAEVIVEHLGVSKKQASTDYCVH